MHPALLQVLVIVSSPEVFFFTSKNIQVSLELSANIAIESDTSNFII